MDYPFYFVNFYYRVFEMYFKTYITLKYRKKY